MTCKVAMSTAHLLIRLGSQSHVTHKHMSHGGNAHQWQRTRFPHRKKKIKDKKKLGGLVCSRCSIPNNQEM